MLAPATAAAGGHLLSSGMQPDEPGRLVLIRHGETHWSRRRRHTGRTDIPLDDDGRTRAAALRPLVAALPGIETATIWVSPLRRARDTAELAGLSDRAQVCDDLLEWDYGVYEGRTTSEIRTEVPGWTVWNSEVPGGETLDDVAARADRVIERASGPLTVLVAHAHFLRILTARWLQMSPDRGRSFTLEAASMSILGHEREERTIEQWNVMPAALLPLLAAPNDGSEAAEADSVRPVQPPNVR
jgi:broad specificity phosphatase PhoE